MVIINLKEFEPLNSHQVGIKIKNLILKNISDNQEIIVLNFKEVDICTDSFIQQLTIILSKEITYNVYKKGLNLRI
ncbi:hypothetical protein MN086_06390 [Sulfurovum sp. XGS-02]|uniref:hypothetical protein n=1 Tax=Sulfurovum sp. XGS-02 TaxID=2925411 RepID=UPI0020463550|nr:hypothetical protein [Sulfurovum sp. XGS-02]UPT76681.1 hypothetical protein MN086_06390 [Sulfurovum sp. XGS-02]